MLNASASAAAVAPRMLLLDGAVIGPSIVVVGERGTILRSTDSGKTWERASSTTNAALTGITFTADNRTGWAVGHDALILSTSDGGRTWQKQWQGENLTDSFLDVLAFDANYVIAVGAFGLCMATTDGGRTWTKREILEEDSHLNRLTRGSSSTFYLAGEHGTLMRSVDRGVTWRTIKSTYEGSFYGILPLDIRTLIAYGLRGRIYRSTDNGERWQAVPNEQPALLTTAVRLRNGTIVAAGQARTLFVSSDDGRTFVALPSGLTTAIAELIEAPDGSLLALGEAGVAVIEVGRIIPNPPSQEMSTPQPASR